MHEAYDMTDTYVPFACSATGEFLGEGELVRLHGSIYERIMLLHTPAGGVHTTWHTMPVGLSWVGEGSGEVFRVREAEHGNSNQTMNGVARLRTVTQRRCAVVPPTAVRPVRSSPS